MIARYVSGRGASEVHAAPGVKLDSRCDRLDLIGINRRKSRQPDAGARSGVLTLTSTGEMLSV
jgi:hypothetical protein